MTKGVEACRIWFVHKKRLILLLCIALGLAGCAHQAPAPLPSQPPEPAPPPRQDTAPPSSFVVTKEVYTRTFDEITLFINTLSGIIQAGDFDTWLTYLSEDYIRKTSDPQYLKEQSESPLLKKNNIVLKDLKDYFTYVVVPSRSQLRLDDIEFIDESRIKAISIIRNTRGLLFLLVRIEGKWKIGVW